MAGTRKLAAILAVDVVGYSRLMGEDEAGTALSVREHREAARPIVAGLGGRIVKTMGDGLLLEFPSVVAAVESAIAIQKLMVERNADVTEAKRIVYRIGVNLGDVLIEGDDILGEGVNIAARLEGICEPGGALISGSAYDQVRGKIDAEFVDLGEKALKNIARPVRAYALQVFVSAEPKTATKAKPAAPKSRRMLALFSVGIAALLAAIVGGVWHFSGAKQTSHAVALNKAAHLSIVVLPFANLSNDPNQDYFADGITENLTTDLSRIRNSFVIARNTAFTFKGKAIDAKEIGKELGVRYVLEGSVQRDQDRVRVNVQLVDTQSGAHLWADRFEEDVADLFKLQDQVVARLANSLGNELYKAEAEKGARSSNPDAIDLTMRGRALSLQAGPTMTKDENEAVRALYEQALKIDPNDADALAGDASTYAAEFSNGVNGWRNAKTNYDAKIIGQADRAIALAPNTVKAYMSKISYMYFSRNWIEMLRVIDAGLAINPNSALLYAARVTPENSLGRFAQAKSDVQQAMRLSPRDPEIWWWHEVLGDAEFGLGNLDAAIEEYHTVIDSGWSAAYTDLAAAYALDGKMEEAKAALAEARRLEPRLTIKWLIPLAPDIPRWFDGLRKAGLPEE